MMGPRAAAVCFLAAALVTVSPARIWAANYHYGDTLWCSDCHISHASLRHDETGQPSTGNQPPNKGLIKQPSVAELCLSCHNNQPGTPGVSGPDVNNPAELYDGSERAGGRFSDDSSNNWKGHNLGAQGNGVPGDCIGCHDQHGNNNYRNPRTADESEGPIAFVNPSATGLDRYKRSNVA